MSSLDSKRDIINLSLKLISLRSQKQATRNKQQGIEILSFPLSHVACLLSLFVNEVNK